MTTDQDGRAEHLITKAPHSLIVLHPQPPRRLDLSLSAEWAFPAGAPPKTYNIEGQSKPVVPVKYDTGSEVFLRLSITDRSIPPATLEELKDELNSTTAWLAILDMFALQPVPLPFEYSLDPVFAFHPTEATGAARLHSEAYVSFCKDSLLLNVGSTINQNVLDFSVSLVTRSHTFACDSSNVLHVMLQKLMLFIAGVCGSEIYVSEGGHEKAAYPALSMDLIGEQPVALLACDKQGVPHHAATKLDHFRSYTIKDISTVEHQPAVLNPPSYPTLSGEHGRIHHFMVQPWSYDWRLRLESTVAQLIGGGHSGPSVPPYAEPPSLSQILRDASERHAFLDDKLAIVSHSTGGLITRSALGSSGTAAQVDQAFFFNVPFLGAPKAYFVYLTGDMIPFIRNRLMVQLAPNMPIVYYLGPSESYPGDVMVLHELVQTHWLKRNTVRATRIERRPGQRVGEMMMKLVEEARARGDYPRSDAVEPWNDSLEEAARAFHATLFESPPSVGWQNCLIFRSNLGPKSTIGPAYVYPHATPGSNEAYERVPGDTTVPLISQVGEFAAYPEARQIDIPNNPEHMDAPNSTEAWGAIVDRLIEAFAGRLAAKQLEDDVMRDYSSSIA